QSMVPLFASISIPLTAEGELREIAERMEVLKEAYGGPAVSLRAMGGDGTHVLIALVHEERLAAILDRLVDPDQFFSPYGVRSLSKAHQANPYTYHANGHAYEVAYMPAESSTRMFGGNSNWRGPIWFPMNFFLLQSLNAYARFLGDTFTVPDPDGSGQEVTLAEVGDILANRLSSIFVRDDLGRRAVLGDNDYFQQDPYWRDLVPFYEYFDGDDGHGLGASHQTGWTSLVAVLLQYGGNLRFTDFSR
ncbi:MAG: glucosidase, partial [Actinomycetota bacterium]|nr:glucosidase [Actinomycetota bacterium]